MADSPRVLTRAVAFSDYETQPREYVLTSVTTW